MKANTLLARALYDNHPDCSDELAFSRGDILTVLEQNVPESEGWWKCALRGRQGLAPANRLRIVPQAAADASCAPVLRSPDTDLASSEESHQVPTLLHPPPPGPVYEPMKSWVEGPLPAKAQANDLPYPPSSARIICEKTLSFPKQALFVLPRPARASSPPLSSQVCDVPVQSRVPPTPKRERQQLYDVPTSSPKAALQPSASQTSGQSVPLTVPVALGRGGYNTLPDPQKSEWVYDTPLLQGRSDARNPCLTSFTGEPEAAGAPSSISTVPSPPSSRATSPPPQPCNDAQKRRCLPEDSDYASPVPRNTLPAQAGISYKVPSSFLIPRVEQQNTKPNIYDIPKATPGVSHPGNKPGKAKDAPENSAGHHPSWISRQTTSLSPDLHQLFVSNSHSRASVMSSCSSASTDSSTSSSSLEDSAKELSLDASGAKEAAMALQHKVASSAASLLLYVSRTWRFRDSLEANIGAIRRAADHIEESLREFLDFAQEVGVIACSLTNSHLQARIQHQLEIISNSYQILLDTKGNLDSCHWSLEVLVTDEVQNSLDDLERFVMVARMVPEDVKRFASIVMANARLLFKQNCEREETEPLIPKEEWKCAKSSQLPLRETEPLQKSCPASKRGAQDRSPGLAKSRMNVCGQKLPNLEEKENPIVEQKSDDKKDLGPMSPSSRVPPPRGEQNPEGKVHLSEHCRLYFGALLKALGVLTGSLRSSQPPEVFITQSKLVIMVGQKLVDTLCKETQEKDERNEILRSSGHLCALLKDLALATKRAVLQYPSPAALSHLRAALDKLERHTRHFRGTLE
uniref:cas scaffolding protein family member 4 n=1 Tax=Jaculus jaculus TaxID=51337 RepID=UPI001E1B1BF0|nr:cas scaffolding protein family member 4 [Jaculus jaculus]